MRQFSLLIIIFLLSFNVVIGRTTMGKFVQEVQKRYAMSQEYPIVIFDRDEIGWRFAVNNAFGEEAEGRRLEIIKQYAFERTGVELSHGGAMQFEPYLSVLTGSALAMPILNDNRDGYTYCGVFPPSVNKNKRLSIERIMGFLTPDAFNHTSYKFIQNRIEYVHLLKYSLYHELGHCLDTTYILENYNSYGGRDVNALHKAESFAETFGLFFLARDGVKDIGEVRAQYRSEYSRTAGPWFATNPGGGFGNPGFANAGAIYFLSDSILAGQKIIDESPEVILTGTVESLKKSVTEIVEEYSFESRDQHAVYLMLKNGKEETLKHYLELIEDLPEFFEKPYKRLLKYIDYTDQVREKLYSKTPLAVEVGERLVDFNILKLCGLYRSGEKDQFFCELDFLRENLKNLSSIEPDQLIRSRYLDDIYLNLTKECLEEKSFSRRFPDRNEVIKKLRERSTWDRHVLKRFLEAN